MLSSAFWWHRRHGTFKHLQERLLHTFTAGQFERLSHRYPRHAGLWHLLGEVEVVFGFWAVVLVLAMALLAGGPQALHYAETRNYTEPLFVFVVMVMAVVTTPAVRASRPAPAPMAPSSHPTREDAARPTTIAALTPRPAGAWRSDRSSPSWRSASRANRPSRGGCR